MAYLTGPLEAGPDEQSGKGTRWLEVKVTRLYLSKSRAITFRSTRGRGWVRWQLSAPERVLLFVAAVAVASWPSVRKVGSDFLSGLWKSTLGEVIREGGSSSRSPIQGPTPPNLNGGNVIWIRGGSGGVAPGVRSGVPSGSSKHRSEEPPTITSSWSHPLVWNLIAPASSGRT